MSIKIDGKEHEFHVPAPLPQARRNHNASTQIARTSKNAFKMAKLYVEYVRHFNILPVHRLYSRVLSDAERTQQYKDFHEWIARREQPTVAPSFLSPLSHDTTPLPSLFDDILSNGQLDEDQIYF